MFAIGCKQANSGGKKPTPAPSDEITITVKGDEGVTVKTPNTIKVKKSSTWKEIKQKLKEKITTKNNKEIKEWKLKDAKGEVLKDTDAFEKDETIWCVSKDKENPIPPANPITITIETDEGYTFKDTSKPCTIEVQKGSLWSSIKAKAEAKIELKDSYEKTGWKLGGKDGGYLEDSAVFNENALIFATSKKKGEPDKPKVTITVKGDEGVEVNSSNTFVVDKGSKWAEIKAQAITIASPKENFEIDSWHLNSADGTLINDETEFKANTTVFAVSKRKIANYKVEHWQENIENDDYKKKDEEVKTGGIGTNTDAKPNQYDGFEILAIEQKEIKADNSTVIQIKYKRNRVSLVLDLDGGATTTSLSTEDDKTVLKGKFGASIHVENPTKENYTFEKCEPALPSTFPSANPTTVYTAKWRKDIVHIKIRGDERIEVYAPEYIDISTACFKTFEDIKSEIEIVSRYVRNLGDKKRQKKTENVF